MIFFDVEGGCKVLDAIWSLVTLNYVIDDYFKIYEFKKK